MNEKILIAAGGTGGHIYPALAIAEALKNKFSGIEIEFVGPTTGVENEIIPRHGYKMHQLSIGRLHRSVGLIERIATVVKLPFAILKAFGICFKAKPRFLLGVGGHASGPMLLAGALMRYPTYIWEPNALPGLANRILSGYVDEAIVVFAQAAKHLKTEDVTKLGFPVRKAIETVGELGQEPRESSKLNVLVYMGSQGAQSMNRLLPEMLAEWPDLAEQFNFLHQTGKNNLDTAIENYQELEVEGKSEVVPYIDDMHNKYVWADLVVCRSGTGTLSEIAATGKPSILIPLPFAADDHQRKNADAFVEKNAAVLIDQKELTVERLRSELLALREKPDVRTQIGKNAFQLHISNSAEKIADHLWEGTEVEYEYED